MGENEMVTISYIYWLAAGLLLAAAEMIVPGFILFWFGMAAFVVGLVTLALPALGWPLQIAAFAVLTTVFMGFWWLHQRKQPKTETESEFNSRARDMVGKTLTLTDPIRHGSGKTFVGDTLWHVSADEAMEKGSLVRVVSYTDDAVLRVELVAPPDAVVAETAATAKDPLAMGADSARQVTDPTA
tara:strand:+ start:523 stop:1077 length:555 start_codon:yes stop_codon:yes gene_type:complete